jgi:futalosine hydrolase
MKNNIVVLAATHKEIDPFLNTLSSRQPIEVGKREVISGYYGRQHIHTVITRPGLVNAVQALTAAIEWIKPSLIIQTGCAGAFKQAGIGIGDIVLATEEIDLHSGIEANNPYQVMKPLPFQVVRANQQAYANRFPLNRQWTDAAFEILTQRFSHSETAVFRGLSMTASTITASDDRAAHLFENFQARMEQMEGSGTAHVALLYDIPCIEIRCASNWVGKRELKRWDIPLAAANAAKALAAFVKSLPTLAKLKDLKLK